MKILTAAAVLMLLPATGLAQTPAPPAAATATGGAAATLPNTFDAPARAPTRAPAARAPTAQATPDVIPAEAGAPADPAKVAAAETALKATIAAFQNGAPNYDDMSADLAAKVRESAAQITPLIQGFGTLQSVTHAGNENGAELFAVVFEKQATQWILGQADDGKIIVMLFRPAPAAAPAA